MKKLAIAGALMLLAGCAEVENYNNVVKTPAPDWLTGYWQTKGPQRALVSPEAIGSLIVTKEGDTLDCRQWQSVPPRWIKRRYRRHCRNEISPACRRGWI